MLADIGLKPEEYFLVTSHRQENIDNKEKLGEIIRGLKLIKQEFSLSAVFPVHPRTRENTERPETIEAESNVLVGAVTYRILEGARLMLYRNNIVLNATFLIYCRYIMRHGKKARKGDHTTYNSG